MYQVPTCVDPEIPTLHERDTSPFEGPLPLSLLFSDSSASSATVPSHRVPEVQDPQSSRVHTSTRLSRITRPRFGFIKSTGLQAHTSARAQLQYFVPNLRVTCYTRRCNVQLYSDAILQYLQLIGFQPWSHPPDHKPRAELTCRTNPWFEPGFALVHSGTGPQYPQR